MTSPPEVSYRSLFDEPGRKRFLSATAIGRLPNSMRTISCILMVEQITGSYGIAGLVGATQGLVFALVAPVLGRMIDLRGERQVILWALLIHIAGVGVLIGAAYSDLPSAFMLIGAGIFGGSAVQFGSISRARWARELHGGRTLERAYALEGMIDEVCFILSPMVAVLMALQVHPTAGVLSSLMFTAVATLMLVVQRAAPGVVRPTVATISTEGPPTGSVIRIPTVMLVSAGLLLMGTFYGSVQITSVAFTQDLGNPEAVGWIAIAIGVASLLGAALYGARSWSGSIAIRIIVAFWWVGLSSILFLVSWNIPTIMLAGFVMGLASAPAVIATNVLIEQVAPPERITEAFTWLTSALASGSALGAIMAGQLVDEYGVRAGMLNGVAGGVACAVCVTIGWRLLRMPESQPKLQIP